MATDPSVQRSFRISVRTADLLDAAAERAGTSRNAITERLLAEALRTERHPLIGFASGAAGRREPTLLGTRLKVRDVIATVRVEGDQAAAAEHLAIAERLVRAAVDYYADFSDEVDADQAWADRIADDEHDRWQRARAALA